MEWWSNVKIKKSTPIFRSSKNRLMNTRPLRGLARF